MYSFTLFYKGEQYTGIERETIKNMAEGYDPLKYGDRDHIEPYKKSLRYLFSRKRFSEYGF